MTDETRNLQTRRAFLGRSSMGLGALALNSILQPRLFGAKSGVPGFPSHAPKVKRIIFLCMAGGPAHLELLDHKPELAKRDGEPMPESFTKGQQIAQLQGKELKILGPQHPFKHYGKSGQYMTSQLPKIGEVADDICIIRSMQTEQINHDTAHTFMNTGFQMAGRPSMGSWASLRAGKRRGGFARFRCSDVGGRRAGAADRGAPMALGLSAEHLSGRQVQLVGRSGQLRPQPRRCESPDAG